MILRSATQHVWKAQPRVLRQARVNAFEGPEAHAISLKLRCRGGFYSFQGPSDESRARAVDPGSSKMNLYRSFKGLSGSSPCCHCQGQSCSCSYVLLFAVLWVLASDPSAQGVSEGPAPSQSECVLLTCVLVVFPKASRWGILQRVVRGPARLPWAWMSAMLERVGKYCVVYGWKFNVCCEFVGLKHWKFFIRQCLHTSPEEPLRVYIWNFKIY